MNLQGLKYLVVGSGICGAVIAERIANDLREKVLVIEKLTHAGGNCHSEIDANTGIEVHRYGSHIFHTSDICVWDYISGFCSFNNYRHKVLTKHNNKTFQLPVNLHTINSFYGSFLNPSQAMHLIQSEVKKENLKKPTNLEATAISLMGRPLYESFIKGYTMKQWETDPKELPSAIIARLPVRFNYKTDYFEDRFQGIPLDGYGSVFNNFLSNKNIELRLKTDFFLIKNYIPSDCLVIFTGPIDSYFDYKYGGLGWRSISLQNEVVKVKDFQGTSVMNYADIDIPYTRIHEYRHFHDERSYPNDMTIIGYEYSTPFSKSNNPSYPIRTDRDMKLLDLYLKEADLSKNVIFGGRLGTYKYLDMDKAIAEALNIYYSRIRTFERQVC